MNQNAGRPLIAAGLIVVFVSSILSGCATPPEATAENTGMATCKPEDMVHCQELAGFTHLSGAPTQVEYIAPDGQLFLWRGDKIIKGRWKIAHGITHNSMCYQYGGGSSNCELLRAERKMKDGSLSGDPFGLSQRTNPPFALSFFDRRKLDDLLVKTKAQGHGPAAVAPQPSGR
jgi:hypothetical protein